MKIMWAMGALSGMAVSGCTLETVDLRGDGSHEEQSCPPGERIDPQTGACAPCQEPTPHPALVCPCDYTYLPAPYPYCSETYTCLPCSGDITACSAFNAITGNAYNCDLLEACCGQLAADPESTPCCPQGTEVVCTPTDNLGEYALNCSSCCLGVACPNGNQDCAPWQSCDSESGLCSPACNPQKDYCCKDCGCTCQPLENPPI